MEKTPVTIRTAEKEFTLVQGTKTFLGEIADKAIVILGTLGAPFQFLLGKKDKIKDLDTHLRIYKDLGRLELYMNDTDARCQHVITGSLSKDKNLESFRINTDATWSVSEFLKFIRTKKFFFAHPEDQTQLIAGLQTFGAKVERVIKEHNDSAGNSLFQLETKVNEMQLKRSFILDTPIFQGYDRKQFKVEIGFQPTATQVHLFLISEDLFTIELEYREKLINDEIKKFDTHNFSKVVVS
jgi:hypothetical protein